MSNTIWKKFELWVAKGLSAARNMGSGRINCRDDGKDRPGDVVLPVNLSTLVECKTRTLYPKSGIYYRVVDTLEEAKKEELKNWFHLERKLGSKKIIVLATSPEWMEFILQEIRKELDRRADG